MIKDTDNWRWLCKQLMRSCRGSGPGVFAYNVNKQGWCSDKQLATMQGMYHRLVMRRMRHSVYTFINQKSKSRYRKESSGGKDYGHCYSSDEEMASTGYGEY